MEYCYHHSVQSPTLVLFIHLLFPHFNCFDVFNTCLIFFFFCVLAKYVLLICMHATLFYKWYWLTSQPVLNFSHSALYFEGPSMLICAHLDYFFQLLCGTSWFASTIYYLSTYPVMNNPPASNSSTCQTKLPETSCICLHMDKCGNCGNMSNSRCIYLLVPI